MAVPILPKEGLKNFLTSRYRSEVCHTIRNNLSFLVAVITGNEILAYVIQDSYLSCAVCHT